MITYLTVEKQLIKSLIKFKKFTAHEKLDSLILMLSISGINK